MEIRRLGHVAYGISKSFGTCVVTRQTKPTPSLPSQSGLSGKTPCLVQSIAKLLGGRIAAGCAGIAGATGCVVVELLPCEVRFFPAGVGVSCLFCCVVD